MNWIMQEDATRRFVFGFTIANTAMRLWFASRSEVLVSAEFDFMTVSIVTVASFLRIWY